MRSLKRPGKQSGVTLVEMMVAIVVGLIVIAAVLALIVSIMKANRQSIEATRLMQEMRATAAVIASDVRRARGVTDPLATVKLVGGNPYRDILTTPVANTAGCIRYAYDGGASGPFRVVYRDANTNKVITAGGAAAGNATCTSNGVALTSDQVQITALSFQRLPLDAGGNEPPVARAREIRITMTGQLVNPDAQLAGISRTITQSIFIRALGEGS
ncbi:PilW family protein [Luteimonas vadosa]